ncbi:MAG: S8 family serine peptidase [Saprospiraceae bacterium]
MKIKITLLIVALTLVNFVNAQQHDVPFSITKINTNKVSQKLLALNTFEKQTMIISMADRVDIIALKKEFEAKNTPIVERTELLIRLLKEKATITQPPLLDLLRSDEKVNQISIKSYWITNTIMIHADLSILETLSHMDEIRFIELNPSLELHRATELNCEDGIEGINAINGIEPGLEAINAPAMWALGYTGFGTKALSIDTGVETTHPALSYSYEGIYSPNTQAWYPIAGTSVLPVDCDGHGTHTVGTMLGLDRENNDTIGVAFDATWMATPIIQCDSLPSNFNNPVMDFLQWAIDPDGDSTTIDDMPTVICNSWGQRATPTVGDCNSLDSTNRIASIANAILTIETAGVAAIFAAGNDGPNPSTIGAPAIINTDLVSIFSVGALQANGSTYLAANFSSRGPTICGDTGALLIKPEVSAPGVSVRSSYKNGRYVLASGTSMAAPHVSGAVLLLKQAFPYLTGEEFKLALYYTAIDLGVVGEDNIYGRGIIDVYAAYQYLINQGHTPVSPYSNRDLATHHIDLPKTICDTDLSISPSVSFINRGLDTIYNSIIRYTVSNGITDTIQWSGTLLPQDTIFIQVPTITLGEGEYTFEIKPESINGLSDERPINHYFPKVINLTTIPPVTTTGTTVCPNSDVFLTATHPSTTGQIRWYSQEENGVELGIGNSIILPSIVNDETYYSDIIEPAIAGAVDNSIGNGLESNDLSYFLEFDCYRPFILKSVKVYTTISGGRRIVLKDNQGTILNQKLISLTSNGENIINLDWNINEGEGFQISFNLAANCYVNTSGASFPYTVPDIMSITGSNISATAYPYFYGWEIEYGHLCGRVPVTATLGTGNIETNFSVSTTNLDLALTNGEVTFTDLTQNATSWFWDFGDGNTSTAQNPTHIYTQPETYDVYLQTTDNTGCSDAISLPIEVVNFPVSTNGIKPLQNIAKVYPNPTNDILNIELRLDKTTAVNFRLVNAVGQTTRTSSNQVSNNQVTQLNLSDLPSGIYFLQIQIDEQIISKKVIRY